MVRWRVVLALTVWLNVLPVSAQQVNFYAWGGQPAVNDYLRWAAQELRAEGIELRHVKVADIAEVVKQITLGASNADLVWINGENFHALKAADALLPIAQDIEGVEHLRKDIAWQSDFGEAVADLEIPWGMGQFYLLTCAGCLVGEQMSAQQLLEYAQANPGRISYPRPPEFHGTTFLKMLARDLVEDEDVFQQPVADVNAAATLAPLWRYLEQLHPLLWQVGEAFPSSAAEQLNLFAQAQLHMAVSFNPNDIHSLKAQGRIPSSSRATRVGDKAISNSHYLAIPRGAAQTSAAKRVIEFMLSERAQVRKAAVDGWGDPAVIEQVTQTNMLPAAKDFHASWQSYLEQQWSARFQ